MSTKKDKSLMLNEIKEYLNIVKDAEFANYLGIKPQTLSSWYSRNTFNIELLYAKCGFLKGDWLISGEGSMIKEKTEVNIKNDFRIKTDNSLEQQRIPLYSIEATAGLIPLFDNHNQIETEEYISIPHVPRCDGALFVTGDSMYPLLKSGDIVAYQKVHDKGNYIFWGEMYLLSIDMGGEEYVSVKYVQKSEQGKEFIKLVSENRHHQPQDVHIDDIRALALVKASVRINSM